MVSKNTHVFQGVYSVTANELPKLVILANISVIISNVILKPNLITVQRCFEPGQIKVREWKSPCPLLKHTLQVFVLVKS